MFEDGHAERSGAERPGPPDAGDGAEWPVRAVQRRRGGRGGGGGPQRPLVPVLVHLAAAAGRAVPGGALRPVHAAQQHHGHRQHLRARRPPPILGRRVGPEHPLLPRPPGDGPSGVAAASLVGAVRPERVAVLHAAARGAAAGGGRAARLAHGGGQGGGLHGPHPDLPGAGGEAQGVARRLGRVLLLKSRRPIHHRCVRAVGRGAHRELAGEVSVRAGGVLPHPVPEPAHQVRQAAPAAALAADGVVTGDRAAVLRAAGRQDAHRDPDPGHAAVRVVLQLALHGLHVTQRLATARRAVDDTPRPRDSTPGVAHRATTTPDVAGDTPCRGALETGRPLTRGRYPARAASPRLLKIHLPRDLKGLSQVFPSSLFSASTAFPGRPNGRDVRIERVLSCHGAPRRKSLSRCEYRPAGRQGNSCSRE